MIKNILTTIIIELLLLFSATTALFAEEVTVEKKFTHRTVYTDLGLINTTETVGKYLNYKIKKGLKSLQYCDLVPEQPVSATDKDKPGHSENEVAVEAASVHRIISGTAKHVQVKFYHEKGKRGKNQYILRRFKEDYFSISVEIFDVRDDETIAVITEKSEPDKKSLDQAMTRLIERISKYYGPRKAMLTKDRLEISLSLAGTFLMTEGSFHEFSKFGYGTAVSLTLTNVFVRGLSFQIYAGYYYIDEEKLQLDALHSVFSLLLAGYSFTLHKNVRITPYLGVGYHYHIAVEYTGNKEFFFDPYCTIQCELSFPFLKRYAFFITPAYNFFFEEKNIGRYFSAYAGFRFTWYK